MLGPTETFVAVISAIFVVVRYTVTGFRAPKTPRQEAHRRMLVPCLLALLATRGHVLRAAGASLLVGLAAQRFDLLDGKQWAYGTLLAYGDWMFPYTILLIGMYLLT